MYKWTFAGYHRKSDDSGWIFRGTPIRKDPSIHELLATLERFADLLENFDGLRDPPDDLEALGYTIRAELLLCREPTAALSNDETTKMKQAGQDD